MRLSLPAAAVLASLAAVAAHAADEPAAAARAVRDLLPEFVRIPAGTFVMGSPVDEPHSREDEVQHEVTLTSPFLLAATEVTQALWEAVIGRNPAYFAGCPDCPVEQVTWYDALVFCNRLSALQGFAPAYLLAGRQVTWNPGADGYRLPTEAEWEYACRAGTATAFHTGPCLDPALANYDGYEPLAGCPPGLNRDEPIAVQSLAANAWGLYDMHGNVAEWCWDLHGDYPRTAVRDPRGADAGRLRITRGGSWGKPAWRCRSANRQPFPPDWKLDMIGLRLARTVQP